MKYFQRQTCYFHEQRQSCSGCHAQGMKCTILALCPVFDLQYICSMIKCAINYEDQKFPSFQKWHILERCKMDS